MTLTDYHLSLKTRAVNLSDGRRSRSLPRIMLAGFLSALFAVPVYAAPTADFAMTCTSGGSLAHVQSLDKPYESTGENSLAGKTLSLSASVITKPEMVIFAPKPKQPMYRLELSMAGERLIGIAAQTYDETNLSAYSDRIALVDAFGSGSSLMLLADGTGAWKGRVISTEGILDRSKTDVTIYIALTCRKADPSAPPGASQ